MVTSDPDTQDASRVRALSEDHALPVLAIHAPFLLMSRRVWGRDPVGKIDRAIELALGVGAPLVVVHPPYRWQSAYRRWLDERLPTVPASEGCGSPSRTCSRCASGGGAWPGSTPRQSLDELEGIPDVTLDTSHLAVSGIDPVEAAARLGDRLAHVHLSNNAGKGWDSHLPLDEGVLDLGPFLEALAARGFRGAISLEIDLRDHLDDDQALRGILSRNRDLCEAGLTLPA
jgi:sugar phosphate isomerase/epimerase